MSAFPRKRLVKARTRFCAGHAGLDRGWPASGPGRLPPGPRRRRAGRRLRRRDGTVGGPTGREVLRHGFQHGTIAGVVHDYRWRAGQAAAAQRQRRPLLAGQVREVSGQGGSLGVHQRPDAARVMQAGCRFWCSHSDESAASGTLERRSVWSATDQPDPVAVGAGEHGHAADKGVDRIQDTPATEPFRAGGCTVHIIEREGATIPAYGLLGPAWQPESFTR